ncbi:MAG: hypothetical protein ACTSVF_00895 [Candidatus Asgardarchaeia archaeon]
MQFDFSQLAILSEYTAIILIISGLSVAGWFFESISEAVPIFGKIISPIIKLIAALGFIMGIICIITGYYDYVLSSYDRFTIGVLGVVAFTLTVAPIVEIPIESLLALGGGGALALAASTFVPDDIWTFLTGTIGISMNWMLVIIFLIGAAIIYSLTKMITDLLRIFSKIVRSKPVSFIVGVVAITQGILLLMGLSLTFYLPI